MALGTRLHLPVLAIFICIVLPDLQTTSAQYHPNWASLDKRPLPEWFDESKLGIFINWGLYSVPSFAQRGAGTAYGAASFLWYWWKAGVPACVKYMEENYPPGFTYGDFVNEFKAEFFNPNEWASLFKASGARYVVFSTKHHEGFTTWPSKFSWNWNSMDVGPKRDLVGDFAAAIRSQTDLHFGLYHSLFEWFHPLYLQDKKNNFTTQDFVATKTMPELYEIVNAYKPDLIWSDGEWEAPDTYWNSTEFIAWLYNDSPVKDTVVTNDRWGKEVRCHHGGYFTCQDRYDPGIIHTRKWETSMTIDRDSWGFRRNAELSDYLLPEDLVHTFVVTVRYVVFSTKHHEGFTTWPSKFSWNWNSMDVGPKRDLVGDLAAAIRNQTDLHFGLYHSLFEWFHPLYLRDKKNNFHTQDFVATKTMPELYEIVNAYKPEVIWSDGDWEAPDSYWNSTEFIAWLYNDSPVKDTVVINDRWGKGVMCHHGGYFTCQDRYDPGIIQTRKWENAMTIDRDSWGFRRNAELSDYLLPEDLVHTFVVTVSTGGNMLMNVGPKNDGTIAPIYQERLQQMGQWLAVNGEAIYATKPWVFQNDTVTPDVWYTSKWPVVYAITLKWPTSNTLHLSNPVPTSQTNISLLGYRDAFTWTRGSIEGIDITIPIISFNKMPCQWAWVFKLEGLQS